MTAENTNFTSSSAFFEAKYKEKADPWNFTTDAYELQRYDAIVSAISHQQYRRAFEPGCSIGVLTERLADYCDAVYAIDFSPSASKQAKDRCAHLPNVEVRCASILEAPHMEDFDLLMLCEIGYYFSAEEWQRISSGLIESLPCGATVLGAHWLGESQDHRISGDEVHAILFRQPGLQLEYAERSEAMRLDRWMKL